MINRMKTCRICKESKENYNFPLQKKALDGFDSRCYTCKRERKKPSELEILRKKIPGDFNAFSFIGEKKCRMCGEIKMKFEFTRKKQSSDGSNHACKDCVNESKGPSELEKLRKKFPETLQK